MSGTDLRVALVANCFLGALPSVDLRVVCLVRALAVPQNKLASGVGERYLNIGIGHLGDGVAVQPQRGQT